MSALDNLYRWERTAGGCLAPSPGLDPAIHVNPWPDKGFRQMPMAGSSPAMTMRGTALFTVSKIERV
jgi:hypothetical protein